MLENEKIGRQSGTDQSKNGAKDDDESASFDTIVGELQTIVERLERNDLSIEAALSDFERGVTLSRRGQEILDQAEKRVTLLLENGNRTPFEPAHRE